MFNQTQAMFENTARDMRVGIPAGRPQSPLLFHVDDPAAGNPPRDREAMLQGLYREREERIAGFGQGDADSTGIPGPSTEAGASYRAQESAGEAQVSRQEQQITAPTRGQDIAAAQYLQSILEEFGRQTGPSVESQAISGAPSRIWRCLPGYLASLANRVANSKLANLMSDWSVQIWVQAPRVAIARLTAPQYSTPNPVTCYIESFRLESDRVSDSTSDSRDKSTTTVINQLLYSINYIIMMLKYGSKPFSTDRNVRAVCCHAALNIYNTFAQVHRASFPQRPGKTSGNRVIACTSNWKVAAEAHLGPRPKRPECCPDSLPGLVVS